MTPEQIHEARLGLVRSFPGAELALGDLFVQGPQPLGEGSRERVVLQQAKKDLQKAVFGPPAPIQQRKAVFDDLYRRASELIPNAPVISPEQSLKFRRNRSRRASRQLAKPRPLPPSRILGIFFIE